MNERRRTVLIVDDEALFRRSLADGLRVFAEANDFVVRVAGNGREAIAIIEHEPVDLVLTDMRMPMLDGLQLIAWMISTGRHIPTVVMSAVPSLEAAQMLRECGAYSILQKPVDLQDVQRQILAELSARRARLEGLPLLAYLQLLSMERSSCVVTVRSRGRVGWLVIEAGDLVEARFGDLEGTDAAYALVGLDAVTIEMVERESSVERSIRVPLSGVLLEALRLQDERRKAATHRSSPAPSRELGDEFEVEFDVLRTVPPPAPAGAPVATVQPVAPLASVARASLVAERARDRDDAVQSLLDSLVVARVRGLIGAEVWCVADGRPRAWHSTTASTAMVFDRITENLLVTLASSSFPALARYVAVDLADDKFAIVLLLEAHRAVLLLDKREAQLGMVLSVVAVDFAAAFRAAVATAR